MYGNDVLLRKIKYFYNIKLLYIYYQSIIQDNRRFSDCRKRDSLSTIAKATVFVRSTAMNLMSDGLIDKTWLLGVPIVVVKF